MVPIFRTPDVHVQVSEAYFERHESDLEQILPVVGPILAALLLLFSFWDHWFDPDNAGRALVIRVSMVVVSSIAFWKTVLPWRPSTRAGFLYVVFTLAIIGATFTLNADHTAALVGMLSGTYIVAMVTVKPTAFLGIVALPFMVFSGLAWMNTADEKVFANSLIFYVLAVLMAFIQMLVFRYVRWKAFLAERSLSDLAQHDALTGLFNRGALEEAGRRELARAQRHGRPLAVMMLDIDHFKKVNDHFGHDGGDLVLKALARICESHMRSIDFVGRYGGEEFTVILPETTQTDAIACGERLRQAVESMAVATPGGPARVTISIGVALASNREGDATWEDLIKRADTALYAAKNAGRNRVMLDPEPRSGSHDTLRRLTAPHSRRIRTIPP